MLLAYLDRQRELVFWKLEGLSDDTARAVSPANPPASAPLNSPSPSLPTQ